MKRNWLYIFGLTIIGFYIISLSYYDINWISTIVVTLATIVGGIAIWVQLRREHDLKEAEFIMEYNNNFIFDDDMTFVQKTLEDYLKGRISKEELEKIDRQKLINFLVYIEALSAMINKGVLTFKTIDNLFSYRFFLAVNNPIVQQLELIPDSEFYKGCYILHKQWTMYKKRNKLPILCEESSLEKVPNYMKNAVNVWR